MTDHQKRTVYVIIGFAISIILLLFLFRNINFRELMAALTGANYWWLLPNIFFVCFGMYQRAYRWRFMLDPIKRVTYPRLLAATCIGFMANNVLPLRLGEFVRGYSLSSQDREITKSAALATIFVERMVFDLVALLLIFGVVLSSSHLSLEETMREGVLVAVVIALVGIVMMLLLALKPEESRSLLSKSLFFLPKKINEKVQSVLAKSTRGLEFIRDPRKLTAVSLQTIVLWVFMGISNYFVFKAFGFDLPIAASFVLLVVVSVSILIPSSPGFVGVYHVGTVWTLETYHIGRAEALSFALVLHAAQYIPITLMGFYYLKKEHLSLKKLEAEASSAE
jgi:glycosyltransferase 2 family protein